MTFIIQRIAQAALTMLLASIVIFFVLRMIPGDPAYNLAGPGATAADVAVVRERMGLDRPLATQYATWIRNVLRGDLGRSYVSNFPAATLMAARLAPTLELTVATIIVIVLVGVPIGVFSAMRAGSRFDTAMTGATSIAIGIPNFWVGIMLMLLFAVQLQWLPPSGRIGPAISVGLWLKSLVLPVASLAFYHSAVLARFVRTSFLETVGKDYVRTARAKGLGPFIVNWRHALRNALIPVITILGITVGRMLGGSVIIEAVFSWPGVGQLIVQSLLNRDYAVVQGCLLLFIATFVAVNLVVDLLYAVVDPRLSVGGRNASERGG